MEPTKEEIEHLSQLAVASGIIKRSKDSEYVPLRLTYHPFRSSQQLFDLVGKITAAWQKLMFLACSDDKLINRLFKKICSGDPLN
jgi:hypothetical protein